MEEHRTQPTQNAAQPANSTVTETDTQSATPVNNTAQTSTDTATVTPAHAETLTDKTAQLTGWGAGKLFAWTMLILASIGEYFSFQIMVDKIKLMQNPSYVPACTLSEIVSCSNVMKSPQASTFGFPNPLLGILGFGVVMTIAVVLLTGARLPRWFWYATIVGLVCATVFIHWLAYSAIFVIWALCPYCMVVWAVTMPLLIMTLVQVSRSVRRDRGEGVAQGVLGMPALVLCAWYAGMAFVIWFRFWM